MRVFNPVLPYIIHSKTNSVRRIHSASFTIAPHPVRDYTTQSFPFSTRFPILPSCGDHVSFSRHINQCYPMQTKPLVLWLDKARVGTRFFTGGDSPRDHPSIPLPPHENKRKEGVFWSISATLISFATHCATWWNKHGLERETEPRTWYEWSWPKQFRLCL